MYGVSNGVFEILNVTRSDLSIGIGRKKRKRFENLFQKLLKELGVGLLNGLICAIIILGAAWVLNYGMALSATVSISLLAIIVFAALFGTFIPLTLEKYKIDPALATGPFITTVNDVLGLFIYFLIGQAIL